MTSRIFHPGESQSGVKTAHPSNDEDSGSTEIVPLRPRGTVRYEIVVRGELSPRFASAFSEMTTSAGGGVSRITGEVIDQAQLHGLLEQIRNLGIELVSVTPIVGDEEGQEITDMHEDN
jgi:hypothetical protein